MTEELQFSLETAAIFSTPSLASWLILTRVRKRRQKWPPGDPDDWRTFWLSYLVLQSGLAILCFSGALKTTGNEDVPVFGIMALTIWGSALLTTPLLSLLLAGVLRAWRKPGNR